MTAALPAAHAGAIWAIALLSILGMLARPGRTPEALWTTAGAGLLLVLGLLSPAAAWLAVRGGLDVYLFLLGMMLLAEVAREQGVFAWVAANAVAHARGSSRRLFTLVYAAGVAVTALLSNDATVVVLTPAVLDAAGHGRVRPRPHLFACALVANAASFVLPISNPANLVVYGSRLPRLLAWLRIFLLPSAAAIVSTYVCLLILFRRELSETVKPAGVVAPLTRNGRLALWALGLAAGGIVLTSAFGLPMGKATAVASAGVVAAVSLRDRRTLRAALAGISWSILPLVASLFVLVAALERAGLSRFAAQLARLRAPLAIGLASGAAALVSNAMNNLPVALAAGSAITSGHLEQRLAHALLLGVDLGPNLSVTGSLATILWLISMRRRGVEISGRDFLRVGALAMPVALAAALAALWLAG